MQAISVKNPIAIGRTPPDFLLSAKRRPPKNTGATPAGQRPARTKLMSPVRAVIAPGQLPCKLPCPSNVEDVNHQAPPADPAGNERTAFLTSSSSTMILEACETFGKTASDLKAGGRFSHNWRQDSLEQTAGLCSVVECELQPSHFHPQSSALQPCLVSQRLTVSDVGQARYLFPHCGTSRPNMQRRLS